MKRERGFSLIEVLVAVMILSGAILVMANAWSGNFGRVRNTRINNAMANLLERKMTEYEVKAKEKPIGEFPEEESGDFGSKFPGYRWEMKSQPFEMPNMTGALTAKDGGVDDMTLQMVGVVQQYIKDAVKEVSVSVFYKSKSGKEIKQAVTTYLIDYTKELPLPNMPGGAGGLGGAPGASGAPGAGGAPPAIGGGK